MAKYPGNFILQEIGTNKELARSWGVSERTIYRWKAKAKAETGIKTKSNKPSAKKIAGFKGTRKELAEKYNISERTAYRWIKEAKEQGYDTNRQQESKYPGSFILNEIGTNKELAQSYGVSERTISRWKAKARVEEGNQEFTDILESPIIEEYTPTTEETESNFYSEFMETSEETEDQEIKDYTQDIIDTLTDKNIIADDSLFYDLSPEEKDMYIMAYIDYQKETNPKQFYNPETGEIDMSVDNVININIWGQEFEDWLFTQQSASMYEI